MELTEQKAPFGSEVRRVERFANSAPPSTNAREYPFYANRQPAWQTRSRTNSAYELPKNDFYYAPRMDTIALKFNIYMYIYMYTNKVYITFVLSKSIVCLFMIHRRINQKKYFTNKHVQISYLVTVPNFIAVLYFYYFSIIFGYL